MGPLALVALLAFVALASRADTIVGPGDLPGDTVWDATNSPVYLTGDTFVPANTTLTVGPGAVVYSTGNFALVVNGSIVVDGGEDPALLTIAPNASRTSWTGIFVKVNASGSFNSSMMNNASDGISCNRCVASRFTNLSFSNDSVAIFILSPANSGDIEVSNISVNASSTGVDLWSVSGAAISNVRANSTYNAVVLFMSTDIVVRAVEGTGVSYLLLLQESSNVSASDLSGWGGAAALIYGSGFHDISLSNLSSTLWTDFGVIVGGTSGSPARNITLSGLDLGAIYGPGLQADFVDSLTVTDLRFEWAYPLVTVADARDVLLERVTGISLSDAVQLESDTNVTMRGLNATLGDNGITAKFVSGLEVSGCRLYNQSMFAVLLNRTTGAQIHGNEFLAPGAGVLSFGGSGNAWDDGASGNYWTPQTYEDADGDGIGDTPVVIPGGTAERDRFPLARGPSSEAAFFLWDAPASWPEDVPFNVSLHLESGSAIVRVTFAAGPGLTMEWASGAAAGFVGLTPGSFNVSVSVDTVLGPKIHLAVTISITDRTVPTITLQGPSTLDGTAAATIWTNGTQDNDPAFSSYARVLWSVEDPTGAVTTADQPLGPLTFSAAVVGQWRVRAAIADAAGNGAWSNASFVVVDIFAPSIAAMPGFVVDEDMLITLNTSAVTDNDPTFHATGSLRWLIAAGNVTLLDAVGSTATASFADPGNRMGTLTACDAAGNCASGSFQLAVLDRTPPSLAGEPDLQIAAGEASNLSASFAMDNDPHWPDGATAHWELTLGPSNVLSLDGFSVDIVVVHAGEFPARIVVYDSAGNSVVVDTTVRVTDRSPPLLSVDGPRLLELGVPFQLSAVGSQDDSTPIAFSWYVNETAQDGLGPTFSPTFTAPGTYHVTLTGTDAAGLENSTVFLLQVTDAQGPTIRLVSPSSGGGGEWPHVLEGQAVLFEALVFDPSGVESVTWNISGSDVGSGATVTFVFAGTGAKTVVLRAVDGAGNMNTTTLTVVVDEAPAPNGLPGFFLAATAGVLCGAAAAFAVDRFRRRGRGEAP